MIGFSGGFPGGSNGASNSINLRKNTTLNLSKTSKNLKRVLVGLGWDIGINGQTFDLDASAFLLNGAGVCPDGSYAIFYGNERGYGLVYGGDNRTGAGDGDDETINVELNAVPSNIQKIAFTVSIYDAIARRQNFGQVRNAFIRIVDLDTNQEICRYSLTDDYGTNQSVIIAEIYREGNDWVFKALGDGVQGELGALIPRFGLQSQ